jgi:lysophospholipid acyltransferase (LPLAT)-like uncharacterized protein
MAWSKRLASARPTQVLIASLGAAWLRLVWKTSRFVVEPPDLYERMAREAPLIAAMWHGQHFLVPFAKGDHRFKVMITRHRDGEVYAMVAQRLGVDVIRGSGAHGGRHDRKGGVGAFMAMVDALRQGWNVTLTADVPKVARVAGLGVIMIARASGRPIFPVGVATSRRITLDNWDKTAINLPFSRGAVVVGEPIRVPADADDEGLEQARKQLEQAIEAATMRAYAIADGAAASG